MTPEQEKQLHEAYESRDTSKAMKILESLPQEELEAHFEINPNTGKKDAIYTLFCQALSESNVKSMSKKLGVSEEIFRQDVMAKMTGYGFPIPAKGLS